MSEGLEDILAEHLSVIFCGINPGVMAAAQGHHFAGRGNRFWRTLHLAGFTPQEVRPENDRQILQYQCGLTAVVDRPTARADQLSVDEFTAAAANFEQKIARHAPRFVAFLGKAAYCALSRQRDIAWGLQTKTFGNAAVWVLPNPSGRNLAFSQEQLIAAYRQLYLVNEEGQPLGRSALRFRFETARAAAGIKGDDFQFRDLRAKAATDKTDSSKDIRQAQQQLGHTSVVMTESYVRKRRGHKVMPTK